MDFELSQHPGPVEHWWNGAVGRHREDVLVRACPDGRHEVELRQGKRSLKRDYRTLEEAQRISYGLRAVGFWLELANTRVPTAA
jgi:hypothetical protein